MNDVRAIIQDNLDLSVPELVELIREQTGQSIGAGRLITLRNEIARASNVSKARTKASERVEGNMSLSDEVINYYRETIFNPKNDQATRLKAANDLRGWLKLSLDVASTDLGDSGIVFQADPEWSTDGGE